MSMAVVIGSGSAGRRHLVALRAEDPGLRITLVRRAGSDGLPESIGAATTEVVRSLDDALDEVPDLAVVASPAPHHAAQIRRLLELGTVVLSEKPLAGDLSQGLPLRSVDGADTRLVVGYHLRFGDIGRALRTMVISGTIGRPRSAELFVGQHLSSWRPGTDPRASVSARQELGGGVLLELSHEIDALRFVLDDEVDAVVSTGLRRSGAPTDGLVETVADLRLRTVDGVEASVHLDMVSDPARRVWRFVGAEGELRADLLAGTIAAVRPGQPPEVVASFESGERDRAESRLIRHLVAVRRDGVPPACGIGDGLAALGIIDAARQSAATGAGCAVQALGATA
jgi:predicted dehydrogenase